MKKIFSLLLSLVLVEFLYGHDQRTHQYIVREGYQLLKNQIGLIPIMDSHVGNDEINGPFQTGLIVTGAYREDEEDLVYHWSKDDKIPDVTDYYGNPIPGIIAWLAAQTAPSDPFVSTTHFWEADNGDSPNSEHLGYDDSGFSYRFFVANAYQKIKTYCGLYLSSSASWYVGAGNHFCCNGYDIDATGGASAYVADNSSYSRSFLSSISGNVSYDEMERYAPVCGSQCEYQFAMMKESKTNSGMTVQAADPIQLLDKKYLALLKEISDAKAANNYNPQNYLQSYQQLLTGYKDFVSSKSDKKIIKAALLRISQLYKGVDDTSGLKNYIAQGIAGAAMKSFELYFKRYRIWEFINGKDFSSALSAADDVSSSAVTDEDLLAEMLYEKGLIYKYYIMDSAKANEMYSSLMSKYPSSPLCKFASLEMSINPNYSPNNAAQDTIQSDELVVSVDNYPNPFNPATTIRYNLPASGHVTLKVYDILGREVATLINGEQQAGKHTVTFNGSTLSSGVYFYRLEAGKMLS